MGIKKAKRLPGWGSGFACVLCGYIIYAVSVCRDFFHRIGNGKKRAIFDPASNPVPTFRGGPGFTSPYRPRFFYRRLSRLVRPLRESRFDRLLHLPESGFALPIQLGGGRILHSQNRASVPF